MSSRNTFRVAIRKFGPFEAAVEKAWASFQKVEKCDLKLQADSLDLHPLSETIFDNDDLRKGNVDIAFVVTDWIATCHERGILLDLAPMIKANPPDDYPQGWTKSLLGFQQIGSQILGLPYHDGPECLIYRKDLFEDPAERANYLARYGSELRLPQTWDEFRQIAQFFTRPEKNLYGTVFAAYPDGHNTVYDFCLQLWTRGGEIFDSSQKMHLDTPHAAEALEFHRAILNDKSAVHPQSRDFDSVKSGMAFAMGEVAMMINWFGFAAMCETIPESKVKGKVAIDTIPHAPGCPSASLNVYWVLAIGAGCPHPDLAYRFLRHCASAPMDKLLTLEGGIGCRKSTWSDAEVNRIIPFYRSLEALHGTARELPRLSNWAELATVIDELVVATINSSRPVDQLAREMQAKAEKLQGR
jgi:multiple sugar transport system substrate-binding protein